MKDILIDTAGVILRVEMYEVVRKYKGHDR